MTVHQHQAAFSKIAHDIAEAKATLHALCFVRTEVDLSSNESWIPNCILLTVVDKPINQPVVANERTLAKVESVIIRAVKIISTIGIVNVRKGWIELHKPVIEVSLDVVR